MTESSARFLCTGTIVSGAYVSSATFMFFVVASEILYLTDLRP